MLQSERDADHRDGQTECQGQVADKCRKTAKQPPEKRHSSAQTTIHAGLRIYYDFLTKRKQRQVGKFQTLKTKGNSHHREAQKQAPQEILEGDEETTPQDNPQHVPQKGHKIGVSMRTLRASYLLKRCHNRSARQVRAALWGALCSIWFLSACASAPQTKGSVPLDAQAAQERKASPQDVEIDIDNRGIPHIFAQSDAGLAYGLGYMHARDRLFQLLVLRYAAAGRVSEILGEAHLEQDRQLRLLDWRIEDATAQLSDRDKILLKAYVDGVNAGAQAVGPSWYMRILGIDFPPMQIVDVLRITRLYAWEMDAGLEEELARARVIERLPADDARLRALLEPLPSGDAVLVAPKSVQIAVDLASTITDTNPAPPTSAPATAELTIPLDAPPPPTQTRREDNGRAWRRTKGFLGLGRGTAWVVSGAHTKSGAPILVSAPEGAHRAPALFYQAHLAQPEFSWKGASIPGMPLLLVGQNQHFAWSATASFADSQDLVRLPPKAQVPRGASAPAALATAPWPQAFRVGQKIRLRETWQSTPFGPVLPNSFSHLEEAGARHALLWTGFLPEALAEQFSGHFDLARARSLAEAERAVEKIGIPSTNLLLAFADGTIAYRLAGILVRRAGSGPHDRPTAVSSGSTIWQGRVGELEKPRQDRPHPGFLVAANQRIVEDKDASFDSIGADAALPHRAVRVQQLLQQKQATGPLDANDLLSLQQDVLSLEALRLAPILAAHCPSSLAPFPARTLKTFCVAISSFDGFFHAESLGALPYLRMREALFAEILSTHLGEDVVPQLLGVPFVESVLSEAVWVEQHGGLHPLLDDRRSASREGLPAFVARASRRALHQLEREGWPLRAKWGDFHRFRSRPLVPMAPLVAALWETVDAPQSGTREALCGESDGKLTQGALLRFVAELDTPFHGGMILDGPQTESLPGTPETSVQLDWQRGHVWPWDETLADENGRPRRSIRLSVPVVAR